MKWRQALLLVALVAIGAGGAYWAVRKPKTLVEYHTPPGGPPLKMEIFLPAAASRPYPTVLLVPHVPTWEDTFKSDWRIKQGIQSLTEAGYAVAMIQYRDPRTTPFPGPIQDMKMAVIWLREHSKTYNIDPDRIGALGILSGGYGVCFLATTDTADGCDPPVDGATSCRIGAAVAIAPPETLWKDQGERANPGQYAGREDPPVLLIGSQGPHSKGAPKSFAAVMEQRGASVTFAPMKSGPQPSALDIESMFRDVLSFFDQHLKKAK